MNNFYQNERKLIEAICDGDSSTITSLISQGVDINWFELDANFTPLMLAVDLNLGEIVRILVEAGADVNLSPSPEDKALELAVSNHPHPNSLFPVFVTTYTFLPIVLKEL